MITITAFYAAFAGLIFTVLSMRVSFLRMDLKQSLGDGGHSKLSQRIRQHANFAEYAPITLILLGMNEGLGAPVWALHAAGIGFLASRLGHAWGMTFTGANHVRFWSMVLCYTILTALSLGTLALLLTWG